MPASPYKITAYDLAARFLGLREAPGTASNAQVLAMLRLDLSTVAGDDVPWCSAFVNYIAWLLGVPRSKSLAARSWLKIGSPADLQDTGSGAPLPEKGWDVVILKRGLGPQPGPDVLDAPGHVGFFSHFEGTRVWVLGGNQGDAVSLAHFPRTDILGIRSLYW